MILQKPKPQEDPTIVIDLTGQDGNAYVLMGKAKRLASQFGYDGEAIIKDMMSGDYEHLLKVFDGYFGDRVIMYR